MCDIDNFKKYNDRYGHAESDACLRKVAQCIQNSLKRPIDFCARYGGEEFVVILPQSSLKGVMTVAERIRENIACFFKWSVFEIGKGELRRFCSCFRKKPIFIYRQMFRDVF